MQRHYPHLPDRRMVFIDQNTGPWFEARATCLFTASAIPGLMGFGYQPFGKCWRVWAGLEKREPTNRFMEEVMQRGHDKEEECKEWLRTNCGWTIWDGGFWWAPDDAACGASPDGLVQELNGELKLLEVKAPVNMDSARETSDKFIAYRIQIEFQMMCTGIHAAELVIWDSPEQHRIHSVHTNRELRYLIRKQLRHLRDVKARHAAPDAMTAAFRSSVRYAISRE